MVLRELREEVTLPTGPTHTSTTGTPNANNNNNSNGTIPVAPVNTATIKGTYRIYLNGEQVSYTESISRENAQENCQKNNQYNAKSAIRCVWNNEEIYARGVSPAQTSSGTTKVEAQVTITDNIPQSKKVITPIKYGSGINILEYKLTNTGTGDVEITNHHFLTFIHQPDEARKAIQAAQSTFEIYRDGALVSSSTGSVTNPDANFILKANESTNIVVRLVSAEKSTIS